MLVPKNRISTLPGALLIEQIMELRLTVHSVAKIVGLPATRLYEIVREWRDISADTTIAIEEYIGQSSGFWMNAQKSYELSKEMAETGPNIRARVVPCMENHAVYRELP